MQRRREEEEEGEEEEEEKGGGRGSAERKEAANQHNQVFVNSCGNWTWERPYPPVAISRSIYQSKDVRITKTVSVPLRKTLIIVFRRPRIHPSTLTCKRR